MLVSLHFSLCMQRRLGNYFTTRQDDFDSSYPIFDTDLMNEMVRSCMRPW